MHNILNVNQNIPRDNPKDWIGMGLILVSALCFAFKAIFIKLMYQYAVPTLSVLFLRLILALPFYVLILAFSIHRQKKSVLTTNTILAIGMMGFLGFYISSFLDFSGLQYIPAGLERIILFSNPTIVLILSYFFLKKKISMYQVAAILCCYVGMGITFLGQPLGIFSNEYLLGGLLVFGAAFSYALYLIGAEVLLRRVPVFIFTSMTMIFSTFFVLIHFGMVEEFGALLRYDKQVYIYAFLMATISTVVPTLMVSEGIKRIGSANSSIISGMSPIFTIILAAIILDEILTAIQYVGALLVVMSVVILSRNK